MKRLVSEAVHAYPRVLRRTLPLLKSLPEHHGYLHAKAVRGLALSLARSDGIMSEDCYPLVSLVAMHHDIGDYKVDLTGQQAHQFNRILAKTTSLSLHKFVNDCIERVSMSREMKFGSSDWSQVLGPGILIRNYVSDADKILSLGNQGYQRILQYNTELYGITYPADGNRVINVPNSQTLIALATEIDRVMKVRMIHVPKYIHSYAGKKLALRQLQELMHAHAEWNKNTFGKH